MKSLKVIALLMVALSGMRSFATEQAFIDQNHLRTLQLDQKYQIKNMYSQMAEELAKGLSLDELIKRLNDGHYLDRVGLRLDAIKNRSQRLYILSLEQSIEHTVNQLRERLKDDNAVRAQLIQWLDRELQGVARSF